MIFFCLKPPGEAINPTVIFSGGKIRTRNCRMADNLKHSLDFSADESSENQPKISKIEDRDDKEAEEQESKGAVASEQSLSPSPRNQRYLVAIEYNGTRFSGSEQKPDCRTVVGTLQKAFETFIRQPVPIVCSSRTDAGVHGLSNVCHVDVERFSRRKRVLQPYEPGMLQKVINGILQESDDDLTVIDIRYVPRSFHARHKALKRTFIYRLLSGSDTLSVFEIDRAWHVSEELDLCAMQQACKILVGTHDFSSFRAADCQAKSPVVTLDELNVTEVPSAPYLSSKVESGPRKADLKDPPNDLDEGSSDNESSFGQGKHRCYVVTARAHSFFYHQVRLMVGLLKCVGTGELGVFDVKRMLKGKSATAVTTLAPACGLYLAHVKYDLPRNSPDYLQNQQAEVRNTWIQWENSL